MIWWNRWSFGELWFSIYHNFTFLYSVNRSMNIDKSKPWMSVFEQRNWKTRLRNSRISNKSVDIKRNITQSWLNINLIIKHKRFYISISNGLCIWWITRESSMYIGVTFFFFLLCALLSKENAQKKSKSKTSQSTGLNGMT